MARLNYETAETLVYDPVAAHRTATRAVLYTLGFRRIETVGTVQDFSDTIRNHSPDLALCEARGADTELCEIIQALRQGMDGQENPFLVVIVTAWEKTNTLVSRVLNSGADDLLLRPFSTALLRSRIEMLVERRKRFVIAHDYVGPDRRTGPGRDGECELFDPPNSLKMKALDGLSLEEATARLSAELKRAKSVLHSKKLRRDAFQIGLLWRLLQEPDTPARENHLAKMAKMTQAVARRCQGTEFDAAVKVCESIQTALAGLQSGLDPSGSQSLGQAVSELLQLLEPGKAVAEQFKAIEAKAAEILNAGAAAPSAPAASAGAAASG
jgi:DNA-binding response OmpR family regulator